MPKKKGRRRLRRQLLPEEVEEIVEMLKKGKKVEEIARYFRVKPKTVYNIKYRYFGHGSRSYRKLSPDELELLRQWLKEGKSIYWIAKQLGRHTSTIYYAALRLGYQPRGEKIGSRRAQQRRR